MKQTIEQIEERVHGGEPNFTGRAPLTNADLTAALNWYRSMRDKKDAKKWALEYLKESNKLGKIKQLPEHLFFTVGFICRMRARGATLTPDLMTSFEERLTELLIQANAVEAVEEKVEAPKESIQDRINAQVLKMCADIDGKLDEALYNEYKTLITIKGVLSHHMAKPVHARKAIEIYKKQRDEMQKALDGSDEQLREGYSHLGRVTLKRAVSQLQLIIDELNSVASSQQRKPRAKKVKSPAEIVKDVKFAKTATDGITEFKSISPEKLIGARQAFVYNCKYRRLGVIVADTAEGLSVNGTSIINYNKQKSIGKTLRKPEMQLSELIKGKGEKYLEAIKAKPSPQTGRLSEDVLIVKVV